MIREGCDVSLLLCGGYNIVNSLIGVHWEVLGGRL